MPKQYLDTGALQTDFRSRGAVMLNPAWFTVSSDLHRQMQYSIQFCSELALEKAVLNYFPAVAKNMLRSSVGILHLAGFQPTIDKSSLAYMSLPKYLP